MSILKWFFIIALFFGTTLFAGVAKVALLKGEATLEREGKNIALKNGDTLEEKDSIKTSKDTQIQLIFEDKTVITLGSESDFQIQEYLNESANQKAKFKFNQGAFKAITGKIGKSAPQNFTLETKTATIGIRGTIIKGKIDPKIGDVIFCEKGAISVRSVSTGVTVIVPAGKITTVMPNTPPTPPRQVQPQDIVNLNQSMEPTPPPTPQGDGASNTPANSGASQAAAPQSIDSTPPPPPPPAPAPFVPTTQTTTPTTATQALQTNLQTSIQDIVVEDIAQEIGVPVEDLQDQIQNQTCPSGTSGTYPNCIAQSCPANTVGIYPDCVALTCPSGTTGTYPDCVALTCPSGTTGTYPDCVALTCPSGTTGTYPDCVALTCPSGTTGTYPDCVALTCPSGTTGTYPDCVALTCPSGTTGTYPDCVALTCPSGTTGTYPDCVAISTSGGTVVQTCPSGTTGTYPDCVALTCPSGTTGTYPNCVDIETTSLIGYATSLSADTNNTYVDNTQALDINISSDSTLSGSLVIASGTNGDDYNYTLTGSTVNYSAKTFSATDSNGSGISMTTSTPLSQHVAWGEWTSIELDENLTSIATPHNYWVAGENKVEAANFIVNSAPAIYSYSGKVLGSTFDGTTYRAITPADPTNKLFLSFDIGSEVAINGSRSFLTFTPTGDTLWDIRFDQGFFESEAFFTSVNGYYDNLDNSYNGYLDGFFYGENAQAIGGTFTFDKNSSVQAYGAFVAEQAPLHFSGLATSSYDPLQDGNITYSISDTLDINISGTQILSSTTLINENNVTRGFVDINDTIVSINETGGVLEINGTIITTDSSSPNDYVSWGYWSAIEVDGNATLMAGTNYWIAGDETPISIIDSLISNSATYTYSGNVLGSVSDGANTEAILMDGSNSFNASVEFGITNPITVTQMSFNTTNLGSVNETSLTTTTSAISGNTFSGNATNANTALDFKGKFFGPNAEAIGGTWKGTFTSTTSTPLSGTGVFKANQGVMP